MNHQTKILHWTKILHSCYRKDLHILSNFLSKYFGTYVTSTGKQSHSWVSPLQEGLQKSAWKELQINARCLSSSPPFSSSIQTIGFKLEIQSCAWVYFLAWAEQGRLCANAACRWLLIPSDKQSALRLSPSSACSITKSKVCDTWKHNACFQLKQKLAIRWIAVDNTAEALQSLVLIHRFLSHTLNPDQHYSFHTSTEHSYNLSYHWQHQYH